MTEHANLREALRELNNAAYKAWRAARNSDESYASTAVTLLAIWHQTDDIFDRLPAAPRRNLADPGECAACDKAREAGRSMLPPHDASVKCKSGKHNHCTCDICF